jgi:hypothetical protein
MPKKRIPQIIPILSLLLLHCAADDIPTITIGQVYNITLPSNSNKDFAFTINDTLRPDNNLFVTV